jgi:spore maturation protein CgeB
MNTLFVGFEYPYGDITALEKSLDAMIFVDSMSKIDNVCASFFPIDLYNTSKDLILSLKKYLLTNKPDIIFFNLISFEIPISLLNFLTKEYITINWFGDDQWRFNDFSRIYAPMFTHIITTDKYKISEYKKLGINNIHSSQWACLGVIDKPKEINYKYDISFVGAYSINREYVIEFLKKKGFKVSVFGLGWNNIITQKEMNEVFLKSKINLNLSNSVPNDFYYIKFLRDILMKSLMYFIKFQFRDSLFQLKKLLKSIKILNYSKVEEQIKARNFEIPSNYGFQISKYAIGIEDYYSIGKELIIFNSLKELEILCKYYLENEKERFKIIKAAHSKSHTHTYIKRLENILNDIN